MPRTQVPEEQQRVSDLTELRNELAPTDERVVFVESAALSEPNFYWWDSNGEATNADGVELVASNMSGFQDGDQDEGLWRRFDTSFEAATTDELAEGSTNLYFSGERVDDRVNNLLTGGTDIGLVYDDSADSLTINFTGSVGGPVNNKVDVGKVRITGTGTVSVTGLSFKPNRIEFKAAPPVDNFDSDGAGGGNSSQEDNYFGPTHGYAKLESDSTISQQVIHSGGSGNSINAVSFYSSSSECISIRVGGQNGNQTGKVRAELQSFNNDGFTLNVLEYSGISNLSGYVVLFTAYKNEDLATSATDVSDNGSLIQSSVSDINFADKLTVTDDGDGSVTVNVNDDLSTYNNDAGFLTDISSFTTDDLTEGATNLYFTDERVDDRVANLIVGGTNITTTYDDVNNTLTIDGSGGSNLQNISTDTTTSGDRYYSVNSFSSEVTLTLSTADAKNGKEISVKRRGKKKVFINTEGSQTIDGSNKVRLNQDKNAVKLVFNSSNSEWEIY